MPATSNLKVTFWLSRPWPGVGQSGDGSDVSPLVESVERRKSGGSGVDGSRPTRRTISRGCKHHMRMVYGLNGMRRGSRKVGNECLTKELVTLLFYAGRFCYTYLPAGVAVCFHPSSRSLDTTYLFSSRLNSYTFLVYHSTSTFPYKCHGYQVNAATLTEM